MVCPKCKSENVSIQAISITESVNGHGIIWWICVGWWWMFIKLMGWLMFGLFMLIPRLFSKNKTKIKSKVRNYAVCQNCGNKWKV